MTVAVVGAGLSGLMTAAELERLGVDTVVLEASESIGGLARTITEDGFALEPAGGGFNLPHPALDHFVSSFGLDVIPAVGDRRRYLARPDRLIELPTSPPAVLVSPVLSRSAKARVLREPAVTSSHEEGESLLGFITRRFGDEAGRLGAHLAASGVFAGDPAELSVEASFPRLVSLEADSGSVLRGMVDSRRARPAGSEPPKHFVPREGMAAMADHLAGPLEIRTGYRATSIEQSTSGWRISGPGVIEADAVVLAIGTRAAAGVVPEGLADLLAGRPTAPVAVVGLGCRDGEQPFPEGFGALTHPDAGLVSLGVLFESAYAPGRAPEGGFLAKVIAGGALRPEVAHWSDDYLVRVVGSELASMLGRSIDVDWVRVVRQRIPQYRSGHRRWLSRVDAVVETLPGLHLTGWGYRGIGIAQVAADALRTAEVIIDG